MDTDEHIYLNILPMTTHSIEFSVFSARSPPVAQIRLFLFVWVSPVPCVWSGMHPPAYLRTHVHAHNALKHPFLAGHLSYLIISVFSACPLWLCMLDRAGKLGGLGSNETAPGEVQGVHPRKNAAPGKPVASLTMASQERGLFLSVIVVSVFLA